MIQLAQICCNASMEVPMKKLSLLLILTLIFGHLLIGALLFCLTYFHIDFSKIAFVSLVIVLNFILYLVLRYWLTDELYHHFMEKRKLISPKQNIIYQFILLFILSISLMTAIIGPILGFELR